MPDNILVTANRDLAALFFEEIKPDKISHLPLEHYSSFEDKKEGESVISILDKFSFIIHGNLLNTRFFVNWADKNSLISQVQNCINLAIDKPTADFLESEKIPAILFKQNGKPIDVMEFMLRISKEGHSLYPTVLDKTEEMPALLRELDMPVSEFTVCQEEVLSDELLKGYRNEFKKNDPDTILIHNRSAITRIKTAFPEIDLSEYTLISGSSGVTKKLHDEGLNPVIQADGTWPAIVDVVKEIIESSAS
jgi:hypothetical protein